MKAVVKALTPHEIVAQLDDCDRLRTQNARLRALLIELHDENQQLKRTRDSLLGIVRRAWGLSLSGASDQMEIPRAR